MTAADRLDQIEARADAATSGPWVYLGKNRIDTPPIDVDEADWGPEGHQGLAIHTAQETRAYRYADAIFIAEARQDVPNLVAVLRAVLALADTLDADVDRLLARSSNYDDGAAAQNAHAANQIRVAIESALVKP